MEVGVEGEMDMTNIMGETTGGGGEEERVGGRPRG